MHIAALLAPFLIAGAASAQTTAPPQRIRRR